MITASVPTLRHARPPLFENARPAADPHDAAWVACIELCARVPRMQEARPCGFVYTMRLGPGDRPGTNAN